jgi:hypothetical protein
MILLNLRTFLNRALNRNEGKDSSNNTPPLSEQSRLLHRLNCIHLDDEEAKCVQAYLTTILECRHQDKTANAATDSSNCIVLEMAEEELEKFAGYVGGNRIRLFRALVQNDNSHTAARKLAVVGENGLRLFYVQVQNRSSSRGSDSQLNSLHLGNECFE